MKISNITTVVTVLWGLTLTSSQTHGMEFLKETWNLGKTFMVSFVCETPNPQNPKNPFPPCFPVKDLVKQLTQLKPSQIIKHISHQVRHHPLDTFTSVSTLLLVHEMMPAAEYMMIANTGIQVAKSIKNLVKLTFKLEKTEKRWLVNLPSSWCGASSIPLPEPGKTASTKLDVCDVLQGFQDVMMIRYGWCFFSNLYVASSTQPTYDQCTIGFMPQATEYCDLVYNSLPAPTDIVDTRIKFITSYPLIQCALAYQYGAPHMLKNLKAAKLFLDKAMTYQNPLAEQILSRNHALTIPKYYFTMDDYNDVAKDITIKSDKMCFKGSKGAIICRSRTQDIISSINAHEIMPLHQKNQTYINYADKVAASSFLHPQGIQGHEQTILIYDYAINLDSLPYAANIDSYDGEELINLRSLGQEKEGPFRRYSSNYYESHSPSYDHGTMITSILQNIAPQAKIIFIKMADHIPDLDIAKAIPDSHKIDAVSISYTLESGDYKDHEPFFRFFTTKNIPVFISAGNEQEALNKPHSLSQLTLKNNKIIPVIATTFDDKISSFSNYPTFATDHFISAPGEEICAQKPYSVGSGSGTSYAAPIAASSYALLKQAFPYTDVNLILQALKEGARSPSGDVRFGAGIIDLKKSFYLLQRHNA